MTEPLEVTKDGDKAEIARLRARIAELETRHAATEKHACDTAETLGKRIAELEMKVANREHLLDDARESIAELEARQGVVAITDEMVMRGCRELCREKASCSILGDLRYACRHECKAVFAEREINGVRRILTAALAVAGDGERVKHLKRGSTYRVLCRAATMQAEVSVVDMQTDLVVYQCESDGRVWVRPACEFDDGRFAQLPPAPKEGT